MPNGFHGSDKQWRTLEAPLIRIDPILVAFAQRRGLQLIRNYRGADRSLRFNDALSRAIWVYASDRYGTSGAYDVSVVAHQDRPARYLKACWIAKGVTVEALERTLERAANSVAAWSEKDLDLATSEGQQLDGMLAERLRGSSPARIWATWIKQKLLTWMGRTPGR